MARVARKFIPDLFFFSFGYIVFGLTCSSRFRGATVAREPNTLKVARSTLAGIKCFPIFLARISFLVCLASFWNYFQLFPRDRLCFLFIFS